MRKNVFQAAAITVFVFAMMWFVSKITDFKFFNAFDPISQALSDFELTDYAFSNLRPDPLVDQRIVVVNIGPLPRMGLAQQISLISQYKPKAIGLDVYVGCEGGLRDSINCRPLLDTLGNLMLSNAIQEAGNVVIVSKLLQKKSTIKAGLYNVLDSVQYADDIFTNHAHNAFANLITNADYQDDVKLCRSYMPSYVIDGKTHYAFATQLAMMYDSAKTQRFLARAKREELINYRGNIEVQAIKLDVDREKKTSTTNYPVYFYAVDVDQLARGEVLGELFTNSIVLLGYLGDYFGDPAWEDKYFTPLNKKVAGRANPDMFGVVVHANIIAMILNEDYVDELAEWQKYAISIVLCFLTVLFFIYLDTHYQRWFDAASVGVQILQLILISLLIMEVYALYSFKLDLTITLASTALVGPCYDVYKSVQNEINYRLTKRRRAALNRQKQENLA
ncbi:MAG: CHASE2 domain-containing protein [Cyclobacteriaceae bacterium]|jgi:CHASE2 domain-containing sensor protein|nr:CHASE2 domain-containing protein [Cyclobacteriaceae bacterium]